MKLLGIRQTGVTGAESISPSAIAASGRTNMQVGQTVVKMVDDYTTAMKKASAITEYNQHYNGSLSFLDEQYDSIINSNAVDEQGKQTYHTMSKGWEDMVTKHITDTTKLFESKTAKGKYVGDMQTYLRQRAADVRGEVRKRQEDHALFQLEADLTSYKTMPDGVDKAEQRIGELMKVNLIGQADGLKKYNTFTNEHAMSQATLSIASAVNEGQLDQMMSALISNPSPYLSANDVNGLITSINSKQDAIDQELTDNQDSRYTELLVQVFNGEMDVQTLELEASIEGIRPNQFDDLKKRVQTDDAGPEQDDWNEYLMVRTNLKNYTMADILSNGMLTRGTRTKLAAELEKLQSDIESLGEKDADWRSSQEAREAYTRIDNADPSSIKIAGLGSISSNNDINFMKRELFDRVEQLPAGQRIQGVINAADELLGEYYKRPETKKDERELIKILRKTPVASRQAVLKQWGKQFYQAVPDWAHTVASSTDIDKYAIQMGVKSADDGDDF